MLKHNSTEPCLNAMLLTLTVIYCVHNNIFTHNGNSIWLLAYNWICHKAKVVIMYSSSYIHHTWKILATALFLFIGRIVVYGRERSLIALLLLSRKKWFFVNCLLLLSLLLLLCCLLFPFLYPASFLVFHFLWVALCY